MTLQPSYYLYLACLWVIISYNNGVDGMSMGSTDNATVKRSNAIITHAIVMTLVTMIGFPFGFYLLITKQHRAHKTIQILNVLLVFVFGIYAIFTFSSNSMEFPKMHSPFSLCTMFLLLLQLALQLPCISKCNNVCSKQAILDKIRHYFYVLIMALFMPFSMLSGIEFVCMTHPYHFGYFPSHFFPGFMFVVVGVLCIWNLRNSDANNIMKYEMMALLLAPPFQLMGDLLTFFTRMKKTTLGMGEWDHILLAGVLLFAGILCAVFYFLRLRQRNLFHRMTVAFAFIIFGYAMIYHKHGSGATRELHTMTGYVLLVGAVFRAFNKVFISSVSLIVIGVFFNFANPNLSSFWTDHLGYPEIPYIVIAFVLGFYVLMVNLVFQQIYVRENDGEKMDLNHVDNDGFIDLTRNNDDDTLSVPFLTQKEDTVQGSEKGDTYQNFW